MHFPPSTGLIATHKTSVPPIIDFMYTTHLSKTCAFFYFNANGHIKYINIITKICGPLCKIHFETSMFNLVLIVFSLFSSQKTVRAVMV